MTKEDIIRMAREAGFGVLLPSPDYRGEIYAGDGTITDEMERFAELIAAAEREACARVCEDLVAQHDLHSNFICARTIRARGEK